MRILQSSTIQQILCLLPFLISLSFRNNNKSYLAQATKLRRGIVPPSDDIEELDEAQFSASSQKGLAGASTASSSATLLRSLNAAAAPTDVEIFAMRKTPSTIFGTSKCGDRIFHKQHPGCRRPPTEDQQDSKKPSIPLLSPPRGPPPTSIDDSPTTLPPIGSPTTPLPTMSPTTLVERSLNCIGTSSEVTITIPIDTNFFRGDVFCLTTRSGESSYFGSTWSRQFGLFANGEAIWKISSSEVASLFRWKFQEDGNLVARNTAGEVLWASRTHEHFGASLIMSKERIWIETDGGQDIWSQPPYPLPPTPPFNGDNSDLNGALQYYAYYYPWYYRNNWSRHGYQDTPLLGLYGTDEVVVAEQHIEWALQAGITSWVISYWGSNSLSMRHFKIGMMNAPSLSKIKFCMLYESPILDGRGNWYDGSKEEALYQDLKVIRDDFFSDESYLRINGRPVIVFYITRSRMKWQEGFSPSVITNMRERLGHDIYFIADEPFFNYYNEQPEGNGNAIANGKQVFDAYTTYNMYEDNRVQDGETATAYQLREAMPIWQNWASEVPFFPNVMPQYYDFRGHKPLLGNSVDFMTQLREIACLPRTNFGGAPHIMFITSFNEWWEGTQIEPENGSSKNWNNYGFQFIKTLASFKKEVDENGTDWCPKVKKDKEKDMN